MKCFLVPAILKLDCRETAEKCNRLSPDSEATVREGAVMLPPPDGDTDDRESAAPAS